MVGTRHAVSDNKSISGLGTPSPYIPEREQIRRSQIGKQKTSESSESSENSEYSEYSENSDLIRSPLIHSSANR